MLINVLQNLVGLSFPKKIEQIENDFKEIFLTPLSLEDLGLNKKIIACILKENNLPVSLVLPLINSSGDVIIISRGYTNWRVWILSGMIQFIDSMPNNNEEVIKEDGQTIMISEIEIITNGCAEKISFASTRSLFLFLNAFDLSQSKSKKIELSIIERILA